MALLNEFAIVPGVFDCSSYPNFELADIHLKNLKDALLTDGIVRNLRDGEWLSYVKGSERPWHQRGKELLKKLALQNRLRLHKAVLTAPPIGDVEWCHEAIKSHEFSPLSGVIANVETANRFSENPLVANLTKLSSSDWWGARTCSVRLNRTLIDYRQELALLLNCANHIMFIDAYFDPLEPRYRDAVELICGMGGRSPKPAIEIHRVCSDGSGNDRKPKERSYWMARFDDGMSQQLKQAGLTAHVFIWDDFHDRYIISDLIGIGMLNGLDTTKSNAKTTWLRLSRTDRDDIQSEFTPATSGIRVLRHKLELPHSGS